MASFFSKLFGSGGASADKAPAPGKTETYADLLITATPMREGSQFRLAGRIERKSVEPVLARTFIRADVFSSEQDALEATFRKARQIIDQQGQSLFADGEASRPV